MRLEGCRCSSLVECCPACVVYKVQPPVSPSVSRSHTHMHGHVCIHTRAHRHTQPFTLEGILVVSLPFTPPPHFLHDLPVPPRGDRTCSGLSTTPEHGHRQPPSIAGIWRRLKWLMPVPFGLSEGPYSLHTGPWPLEVVL